MSLAETIQSNNKVPGIEGVLLQIDAKSQAELLAALDDPSVGHTAIARGLYVHCGLKVSEAAVRRWREKRGWATEVSGL